MINYRKVQELNDIDWKRSDEYYETVLREYTRMLKENPGSTAFVSMANTCLKSGRVKMAFKVLEKGMKHHPKLLSALLCKARIFIVTDRLDRAEEALGEIIARSPDNVLARKLLAETYLKLKKPDEGIATLEAIGKIDPALKPPAGLMKQLCEMRKKEEASLPPASEAEAPADEAVVTPNETAVAPYKAGVTPDDDAIAVVASTSEREARARVAPDSEPEALPADEPDEASVTPDNEVVADVASTSEREASLPPDDETEDLPDPEMVKKAMKKREAKSEGQPAEKSKNRAVTALEGWLKNAKGMISGR